MALLSYISHVAQCILSDMKNPMRRQRILAVLQQLRDGTLDVPEEFPRRHPTGDGISARWFEQVMLISECNGRISELRSKGHVIETSEATDQFGFMYHRLR
jgi:hypothetical protein